MKQISALVMCAALICACSAGSGGGSGDGTGDGGSTAADGTSGTGDSSDSTDDGASATDSTDGGDGADTTDGGTGALPTKNWEEYLDDPTARLPYRNGKWYKDDPDELDDQVEGLMAEANADERKSAIAIVTPHAGLKASGKPSGATYARVKIPDTVIILAPNHVDQGSHTAIWNDGPFIVPGHALHIRHDIVGRFLELLGEEIVSERESWMHQNAHPTEMQLPFLSTINPNVKLVPISFYNHNKHSFPEFDLDRIEDWGKVLAQVITELEEAGEDVLIVATTDLSHYVPSAQAKSEDDLMLDHITSLNIPSFYDDIIEGEFTICGEIPVAIMMSAMLELGYTEAEKIIRSDSSHLTEKDSVVGYPGVAVWK